MKKIKGAIVACLVFNFSFSQNVYHFTKGLVVNAGSRYGREAIYTDQLAYRLYSNTLATPVEGDSLGVTERGQAIKWMAINADSLNRLRTRGGGGGGAYIYLTYTSEKEQVALLNIKGNGGVIFNGTPHAGDTYSSGWLYIPVQLKKGVNEVYVRGQNIIADLIFPEKPVLLNTEDATLPSIVPGNQHTDLMGAIVVINTSSIELKGLQVKSTIGGQAVTTELASVPAMSTRKIIFHFNGSGAVQKGGHDCVLTLVSKGKVLDEKTVKIDAVDAIMPYSNTFISNIDGSLQYYAVTPQSASLPGQALFLSVHGAGVEAIGQARAYKPKDWGNLVAATNRRPRGFNWEDWGRLDALEVLGIAKELFRPDPRRIYLTGHSMGGHGTWFLGATYPDMWAGIGPSAGYPTLKGYGSADGLIPDSSRLPVEQILLRASNQSDVIRLINNYKPLGIYVLHGDADRVVSVNYARQMRKLLGEFHTDLSYYEYPGGDHWFSDECVDWKPLFDFFKWHSLLPDTAVNTIDFTTASPGISSKYRWASIVQQPQPLEYSRIKLVRNKNANTITGTTENVQLLKLSLKDFAGNATINISLDGSNLHYPKTTTDDSIYLMRLNNQWSLGEKTDAAAKGPHRYGTFKEPFNYRMVFVYGTTGTKEENAWSFNKARYDAETWYYRGNGAIDIIADKDYTADKYAGRNIILYGNATTNTVYKKLLSDCPIQLERNRIRVGDDILLGDDLGAYFMWPVKGSAFNSVGVIGGTGLKGMNAAMANQYFAGASGFPDFMIFTLDMLKSGGKGIKLAGYYDNNWKLAQKSYVLNN